VGATGSCGAVTCTAEPHLARRGRPSGCSTSLYGLYPETRPAI
jgi:hypothetical protein